MASSPSFDTIQTALLGDTQLWPDFLSLCDLGGRQAGTLSEVAAQTWCEQQLAIIAPDVRREPTPYVGWRCDQCELRLAGSGELLDAVPLLGSASTPPAGLTLPVYDLGRGTPEQIRQAGTALRGHAVLVRHEYPFSDQTVHRRLKLALIQEAGAAAFLIEQPIPGVGPVSGSSGRAGQPGIPSLGISTEAARALRAPGARITLHLQGEDLPDALTDTLRVNLAGRGDQSVVLSAHLDGHGLAESALDNATGIAAALALTRAFAPIVSTLPRGLTVCVFSAEEWALRGSREWLSLQSAEQRARMALNVNLDSLSGSPHLTALTSGYVRLGAFAQQAAARVGVPLATHLPLMSNSDHANFAQQGIPAMRLIAGFNEPDSRLRFLLTRGDTRDLAKEEELRTATLAAAAILWDALTANDLSALRERAEQAA